MERDRIIDRLGMEKPLSRSKREIVESGAAVVPTLLSILTDEELAEADHAGGGYPPVHAAHLLGELRAEAAIAPMLELLRATDWNELLHDAILQALPRIGAPVVEPALEAYAGATDPELRASVAGVLASCGARDERIYRLLIARFEADTRDEGIDLAEYGDRRALPHLVQAFDQFEIVEDDVHFHNRMLVDLRDSIERLGGSLTIEQEAKFEIAMAPVSAPEVPQPAIRRERPGRNDPCWCGSAKKYKKCHLEADDLAAL